VPETRSHFLALLAMLFFGPLAGCGNEFAKDDRASPFDKYESALEAGDPSFTRDLPNARDQSEAESGIAPSVETVTFQRCRSIRVNCVVDGDTLWLDGLKVRVADIDTPELSQAKCAYERELAERATTRFIELLNEGPFELALIGSTDEDRYGRKLRVIVRSGQSLGDQLVSEGLARTWTGRREPWC
jgi:micrococcal nuclease